MRKGQLSIFVIVGLIIIIVSGVLYWNYNKNKISELKNEDSSIILDNHASAIKNYIEQCLYDVTKKGVYLIGLQGGYIDPEYNDLYGDYDQTEFIKSGSLKIPYWIYEGQDISPKVEQIETKLERYVIVEAMNCTKIDNLPSLAGLDIELPDTNYYQTYFDFSLEESYLNVSINENEVEVVYYFPIKLKQNEDSVLISNYYTEVPIALGKDLKIVKELIRNILRSDEKGYNLEPHCKIYTRNGYTNIFPFNSRILLIDYEPYFKPGFGQSYKLQFMYSGVSLFGYCAG